MMNLNEESNMDGQEVKTFINVWASAIALLCYSYSIAGSVPKGSLRLIAMLPVFYLIAVLPLGLSSFQLGAPTAFILVWLCSFKLLLFTFGTGPLAVSPSCLHFVLVAASPILLKEAGTQLEQESSGTPLFRRHFRYIGQHYPQEVIKVLPAVLEPSVGSRYQGPKPSIPSSKHIQTSNMSSTTSKTRTRGLFHDVNEMTLLAAKLLVMVVLIELYDHWHHLTLPLPIPIPFYLDPLIHGLNLALGIEIVLTMSSIPAWFILGGLAGIELDTQFNKPHLVTSLEDFWGRRWNLTVSGVLRLVVYDPMREVFVPTMGTELGSYAAILVTFFISGLMHEVVYYYIKRQPTAWEALTFFLIHGVCVVIEKALKKRFSGAWHPKYNMISRALTFAFLAVTSIHFIGIPLMNYGIEEKALQECHVIIDFVKEKLRHIFA